MSERKNELKGSDWGVTTSDFNKVIEEFFETVELTEAAGCSDTPLLNMILVMARKIKALEDKQ
jgi:hypothetical protein